MSCEKTLTLESEDWVTVMHALVTVMNALVTARASGSVRRDTARIMRVMSDQLNLTGLVSDNLEAAIALAQAEPQPEVIP